MGRSANMKNITIATFLLIMSRNHDMKIGPDLIRTLYKLRLAFLEFSPCQICNIKY